MKRRCPTGTIRIAAMAMTAAYGLVPAVATARTERVAATDARSVANDVVADNWLVVPRRTPQSIANDGIPRSFRLNVDGGRVSSMFRFNGWDYRIANWVVRPDGFAFDLIDKPPFVQMRAKPSADGRFMDVWIGDDVVGVAPFIARRVSDTELAAIERAAPRPDNMVKLPMPAPRTLGVRNLAPVPPMGWNSWNVFREAVDGASVRAMADALVSSGLRDAGYRYVTIDDGWQGRRDTVGMLHPNSSLRT